MLRICIWLVKPLPEGGYKEEEMCMPVGPIIPNAGCIDPIDFRINTSHLGLTLNGEELPISKDLERLSAISSIASYIQDEEISKAINDGLQTAVDISSRALPDKCSLHLSHPEENFVTES